MTPQATNITPVILAGGSGTRLWPLSREEMPKQFCKLHGELSLFQKAVLRAGDDSIFSPPLILTNKKHAAAVNTQLLEIGVEPKAVILEPCGRDTSAAIALAVEMPTDEGNQTMLVMPSDHLILDEEAFLTAVRTGRQIVADEGRIITMGIKPEHPETGYGYLIAGSALSTTGGYDLSTFVEKPDLAKAEQLLRRRGVFWNAGIFMFSREVIRQEYVRYQPVLAAQIKKAIALGGRSGNQYTPDEAVFSSIDGISFDYAIMEHTKRAALVPMNPKWSDLGSWKAMWETSEKDGDGNAHKGSVYSANADSNLVFSDGPVVGVADLSDIVVVANRDAVLVTSRENSQGVKALVQQMSDDGRKVAKAHSGENRPWGRFDSLDTGEMHQVKRIKVVPGGRLSLQYHHHRAEHWVVVSGMATVTVNDDVMQLGPCQQVFIPQGAVHRLENLTDDDVEIIEVQYGAYLGEDDIVRVEDIYGRDPVETPKMQVKAA